MKRILNHLRNPVVTIMIIFFVIFLIQGCATPPAESPSEKIESIPAIEDSEPVDPVIRDQVIIRVWECMFIAGACS